jgi:hypothetical protein
MRIERSALKLSLCVEAGIAKREDFKRRSKLKLLICDATRDTTGRHRPRPVKNAARASALRGRRSRFYLALLIFFAPLYFSFAIILSILQSKRMVFASDAIVP